MLSKTWVMVSAVAMPAALTSAGWVGPLTSLAPTRKLFRQVAHSDP